jgi:hypothetical protein
MRHHTNANIHVTYSVSVLFCLQRFVQTMRAIQGALIVSSSIQIILGYSQLWAICSRYKDFSLLSLTYV